MLLQNCPILPQFVELILVFISGKDKLQGAFSAVDNDLDYKCLAVDPLSSNLPRLEAVLTLNSVELGTETFNFVFFNKQVNFSEHFGFDVVQNFLGVFIKGKGFELVHEVVQVFGVVCFGIFFGWEAFGSEEIGQFLLFSFRDVL